MPFDPKLPSRVRGGYRVRLLMQDGTTRSYSIPERVGRERDAINRAFKSAGGRDNVKQVLGVERVSE